MSFHLDSPEGGEAVQLTNGLVIPDIPARHPSKQIDIRHYPHLSDLPLNNGGKLVKADILIGMDNGHLMIPYEVRCNPNGNNESYATRTYFGWALSGPVAGSSRQVYANCIQTAIKQHIEVLPRIESTGAGSRAVSPRDRKCINLRKQDKPCLTNSEAKGGKARVAIECACKRNSVSLNDRCVKEPDPTYTLVDGVLRCWQSSYICCQCKVHVHARRNPGNR